MPRFAFRAQDRSGRPQSGVLDVDSIDAAVGSLRRRQWIVLDVQPEGEADPAAGASWTTDLAERMPVGKADVEISLRQLAVMLRSGLTLLDALRMLTEHTHSAPLRKIWRTASQEILAGVSLGDAMSRQKTFPQLVVQLTRVGERTGELDLVLTRASEALERLRKLKSQILTAMAYPVVVFISAVFVAGFMVFYVIPKIQKFLQGMGKKLPAITQLLVDVTEFCNRNLGWGVGLLVVATTVWLFVRSSPSGRWWTDRLFLRVPILGHLFSTAGTAAFARNLSTLLQSGVSLLDSLESIEHLLGNRYLSTVVARAREQVVEGRTLADALGKDRSFQPMMLRMIAIGESAGRLDEILSETARYYEEDLERLIKKLAALVEPAMLVVVGGIVGFVYIAFFMAMFAAARG